ncbi:MAG: Holliday junction branch migration protein RuvA, partial [Mariprofundaceae bacterium]
IGGLRGEIGSLEPTGLLLLNVNGVGYEVNVSLQTLCGLKQKQDIDLLIHTHVREDQITLFGFSHASERRLFRKLITVSGIGAKVAMNILSGMTVDDLLNAIEDSDDDYIARTPGIGKKTAQRLILELKGKLVTEAEIPGTRSFQADVRSALVNLGYKPASVDAALKKVQSAENFELMFRAAIKAIN